VIAPHVGVLGAQQDHLRAVSFIWTPYCATCGVNGPRLRSGGTLRFGDDHVLSVDLFKRWLDEHEYHEVQLLGEGQ
jgi:hypothetical protein